MANNVTNGKPKVGGAIFCAPVGTDLPTSTTSTLATAFKSLGYVSEDGVTNDNSPESEQIKAWGGDTVMSVQTDRPDSFGFTLIEALNEDVLKLVYGSANVDVAESGAISIEATAEELAEMSFVIDMIMKNNKAKRIVIPAGQITSIGTITYKDDSAVGYQLTVTDVPDSTGVYHYEYIA